jgi:hypothetical protein
MCADVPESYFAAFTEPPEELLVRLRTGFPIANLCTRCDGGNSQQRAHFSRLVPLHPAAIQWSAVQPGFQYQSEAPNPSRNLFSVLGREQNGVFFS